MAEQKIQCWDSVIESRAEGQTMAEALVAYADRLGQGYASDEGTRWIGWSLDGESNPQAAPYTVVKEESTLAYNARVFELPDGSRVRGQYDKYAPYYAYWQEQ